MVVKEGMEEDVEVVFNKWDLDYAIIGEVTEGGDIKYFMHGELVADVPSAPLSLGSGTPIYERTYREPKYRDEIRAFDSDSIAIPENLVKVAEQLVSHPNIASKRWVYEQYDSMVGIKNKSTNRQSDAAVVRIPDSEKGIAIAVDCNPRYVHADPFSGTAQAVAEAARNIVCAGGQPVAITNCLNFGNPYDEEVFWQFVQAIQGMAAACEKFNTPVTGGNVSFYNQSDDGPVFPTPTIGMIGVLPNVEDHMTLSFQNENDLIYLIGSPSDDIGSSQYLNTIHKVKHSPPPQFDLDKEFSLQQVASKLIRAHLINSAHDCADGGLFITALESGFQNGFGFNINTPNHMRKDGFLFGEAASRIVVSVAPKNEDKFLETIGAAVDVIKLGQVTDSDISIDGESFKDIRSWKHLFDTSIESILNQ